MKLSTFLRINAVMFIPFGFGMLLMPSLIFPMIGVQLDGDGLLMASTVGSMLLSYGLICLLARNLPFSSAGIVAILAGNLCFHLIDSLLTFRGALSGVMNSFGFIFSAMHFALAIGFLVYLIKAQNIQSSSKNFNNN